MKKEVENRVIKEMRNENTRLNHAYYKVKIERDYYKNIIKESISK